MLAKGYAFASTDKGNTAPTFYLDGTRPGDAILEWHHRVTQLTIAAKLVLAQRYGRLPARTLMTGLSNGGYLTRWQLERVPWLYDGGVDWSGTLFTPTARKKSVSPICRQHWSTTPRTWGQSRRARRHACRRVRARI